MVSIPESRYIKLLEIEKKYKASNFNINERYAVYTELTFLINAGLCISNDINNPGNVLFGEEFTIYGHLGKLCL